MVLRRQWSAAHLHVSRLMHGNDRTTMNKQLSYANVTGYTCLYLAVAYDAPFELVKDLLLHTPERTLKARNHVGRTHLHAAAWGTRDPRIIGLVISSFPEALEVLDHNGEVPFERAKASIRDRDAQPNPLIHLLLSLTPSEFQTKLIRRSLTLCYRSLTRKPRILDPQSAFFMRVYDWFVGAEQWALAKHLLSFVGVNGTGSKCRKMFIQAPNRIMVGFESLTVAGVEDAHDGLYDIIDSPKKRMRVFD